MDKETLAINIPQECADVYYEYFSDLPKDVKKSLSCHMLAEIFRVMVVPAIDHARFVDRFGYSNRPPSKSLEEIMENIAKP